MEIDAKVELNYAFVLYEDDLAKVIAAFQLFAGRTTIEAKCGDNITRRFDSIEQVCAFENSPTKMIRSLTIGAQNFLSPTKSTTEYARLEFGDRRSLPPISLTAKGEEAKVIALRDSVIDVLDGTRAWYSAASRSGAIVLTLALVLLNVLSYLYVIRRETWLSGSVALLAPLAAWIGAIALWWLWSAVRRRYFPVATFAISQGLKRHQGDESFRWGVLIASAVSLIVSIAASLAPLI